MRERMLEVALALAILAIATLRAAYMYPARQAWLEWCAGVFIVGALVLAGFAIPYL